MVQSSVRGRVRAEWCCPGLAAAVAAAAEQLGAAVAAAAEQLVAALTAEHAF